MELAWTRSREQVRLRVPEIQAILVGSGLEVERAELIDEGLANTNIKVETAKGDRYLLRIGQRDPRSQDLEEAIARRLAGTIPVPQVLFRNREANAMVIEWVNGRTLQRSLQGGPQELLQAAKELGAILASIAQVRFPTAGFLGPDLTVQEHWPSCYEGLFGFQQIGLDRSGLSRKWVSLIESRWSRHEDAIRRVSSVACLSHADFKPANLMVDNGRVTGVLDWEFAHAGTWLMDAGQMLRYLGDARAEFASLFEKGMREGGLLVPEDWRDLAATIDLASLVDFLARPGTGEQQRHDVTTLIEATLGADE